MAAHPLHLFFPEAHNNFKAKVLHRQSLLVLLGLFIMAQSAITLFRDLKPGILGYAAFIPPERVVALTNEERTKSGVGELRLNPLLTQAAAAKGADMLARSYWAHNTPDGQEPWAFITNAGYDYLHAGENLARDFSTPEAAVAAWMKSGSHRANLLNPRYQDIGVAVVEGRLDGVETTLVVQMFGTAVTTSPRIASTQTKAISTAYASEPQAFPLMFSPLDLSRSISLAFVLLLIFTLAFDWFIVWRRNLIRLSGKSWAHLTYLAGLVIILVLLKQGLTL